MPALTDACFVAEPPPKNKYFDVAANLRLLKASGAARCVVHLSHHLIAAQSALVSLDAAAPAAEACQQLPQLCIETCTAVLHSC